MKILYQSIFVLIFFLSLAGCASLKEIENPLKPALEKNKGLEKAGELSKHEDIELYFFRPRSLLTIGQQVELYIDSNQAGILGHNDKIILNTKAGTHNLATKVGVSLSIPITGLGGACKFTDVYKFNQKQHFFKIKFSVGLLCGEHEVIEISEEEFKKLQK